MKKGCILLVAAALLAAGSVPATSAKRETKNGLGGCLAAVQMWSVGFKHEIASFMGVSLDRMPSLFCQRLAEGVRSGRIGYSDINRLQLDQATEIWLVIKGKSKGGLGRASPGAVDAQVPYLQRCSWRLSGSCFSGMPDEQFRASGNWDGCQVKAQSQASPAGVDT